MSDVTESGFTLKAGKGYESMWLTPKGSPAEIKSWLMEAFGLEESSVQGMTTFEVAQFCEDIMQGRRNIAAILGGTQLTEAQAKAAQAQQSGSTGESAWDRVDGEAGGEQRVAASEPEGPAYGWLIEALESAATTNDLKRLYAENKDAFKDETVIAAYKARGKALAA